MIPFLWPVFRILLWLVFWPILIFRRNPLKRMQQSIEDPGAALAALLATYGLTTSRHRDWIIFADSGHRARVQLFPSSNVRKGALIQLVFSFEFSRRDRLVETVPGFGDNYGHAVPDAWQTFTAGSLGPIMAAFLGYTGSHAQQEEWEFAGKRWQVTLGHFVFHPQHLSAGRFSREVSRRFRLMIEELPLESGIHWIQLLYSRSQSEGKLREFHEGLLDNRPCEQLDSAMQAIQFPDLAKTYSVRQFIVLLPIGRAKS